ncbi:MAG TPA: hypothetical protein PKX23_05890 [Verrucomicrobiota bacterium]|nr:hypothetical protein [Verrucomicrobiota bacterium]HRT55148.1 hypothetical protein [Candidatus Paceibacterota bacterium]
MRRYVISATCLAWLAIIALLFGPARVLAQPAASKFEAQLIWGTNDSKSPDPRHKPVTPEILERLKELPLKWSHYFEVNRRQFALATNEGKRIEMSDKCDIEVRNLGNSNVEVALFGKGEKVVKRTQPLPSGEILVLGGNAPNATAWLVILKRIK